MDVKDVKVALMVDYPSLFVISQLEHLLLLCEENYIATLLLSNLGEGAKYDQVTWVDEREGSGQREVLGGTLLPLTIHWSEMFYLLLGM